MLGSFGSRLGRMMTFNARHPGALNASILADVIEVTELHHPQLCLRSENAHIRRLTPILRRSLSVECATNHQGTNDEEWKYCTELHHAPFG